MRGYGPEISGEITVQLGHDLRRVSREDRERWKAWDLMGTEGDVRRRYLAHHRQVSFPETLPAFQDLAVDRQGDLWVQAYEPPWSEEDYRWEIFNKQGEKVATASAPFSLFGPAQRRETASELDQIMEIGKDYILIKRKDELGVERVTGHRLRR